jgi:hypothetical protein
MYLLTVCTCHPRFVFKLQCLPKPNLSMSVSSRVYAFQVGKGNPKTQHFVFMIENPFFSTVSRPSTKQKDLQEPTDRS